jgi:hypothetical protein
MCTTRLWCMRWISLILGVRRFLPSLRPCSPDLQFPSPSLYSAESARCIDVLTSALQTNSASNSSTQLGKRAPAPTRVSPFLFVFPSPRCYRSSSRVNPDNTTCAARPTVQGLVGHHDNVRMEDCRVPAPTKSIRVN